MNTRPTHKVTQFKQPPKPVTVEAWVESRSSSPATGPEGNTSQPPKPSAGAAAPDAEPSEPMKRFTIDVGEGLHKRIKAQCALRGVKMADVIRDLLEREFPKAEA